MEIKGTLKVVGDTKTYGGNGFQKREIVVTTDEKFPQDILVEFVKDKCQILDNYAEGQEVLVGINLRGREWESPQGEVKYFNSIVGWRIGLQEGEQKPTPQPYKEPEYPNEPDLPIDDEEEDDLPF
jgi:single-stranded DNA-binding protein